MSQQDVPGSRHDRLRKRSGLATVAAQLMNSGTMTARMLDKEVQRMAREHEENNAKELESQDRKRKGTVHETPDSFDSAIYSSYRDLTQKRKMSKSLQVFVK